MFKSLIRHAEVKVFSPDYLPAWGMRLDHTLLDKEPFFIICRIEITLIVISASILLANSTKVKRVNLRVSYRIIGFRLAIISGGWCNATSEIMKASLLMLLFLSPYLDIYYNPLQFINIGRDWGGNLVHFPLQSLYIGRECVYPNKALWKLPDKRC